MHFLCSFLIFASLQLHTVKGPSDLLMFGIRAFILRPILDIPLLRSICDDYINAIGGHAYNPDCKEPEFVFKNFAEYGTHDLYPSQIHRAYRPKHYHIGVAV